MVINYIGRKDWKEKAMERKQRHGKHIHLTEYAKGWEIRF